MTCKDTEYSSLSMYGYEFVVTREDIIIYKDGHSLREDGRLSIRRHTFEKMIDFYNKTKDEI